eukprot:CAMPEP_0172619946 /NCGR_PEP_ID=MMETSP1068-20121228/98764_1 /TAXON_ID=35684 /ORGANISM="Pseudopedinella elastica, Strain CCMP716" /LENGTH=484 /DNA_ID=CAMNT_0013426977 /DNA_START=198 /DNA_END=1655 /DNA_ORIENTATION=+
MAPRSLTGSLFPFLLFSSLINVAKTKSHNSQRETRGDDDISAVGYLREAVFPATGKQHATLGAHKYRLSDRAPILAAGQASSSESGLCVPFEAERHDLVLTQRSYLPDPSKVRTSCRDGSAATMRDLLAQLSAPATCVADQQLTTDNVGYGFGSVVNSWLKPFMFAIDHKLASGVPRLETTPTAKEEAEKARGNAAGWTRWHVGLSLSPGGGGGAARGREARVPGGPAARQHGPRRPKLRAAHHRGEPVAQPVFLHAHEVGRERSPPLRAPRLAASRALLVHGAAPEFHAPEAQQTLRSDSPRCQGRGGVGGHEAPAAQPPRPQRRLMYAGAGGEQEAEIEPLSAYMEKAVLPIAKKYGVRSIYLATDDEATAQEARAEWPEFVWLVAEGMDRGAVKSVAKWEANLRRGVMDNHLEAQNALIDLLLLAEGDAFVGKFTSNLDRIAFALLAARAKGLVPYVSLDSQWCSDWARAAGSSIYGTFYC